MTEPQMIIAMATFAYFVVGGFFAVVSANLGFAGKPGWEPFALLFAWPLYFALMIPYAIPAFGVLLVAATMAGLVVLIARSM